MAEVRQAYGDRLTGSEQGGRLLFRPDDPALRHLALSLNLSDGKVAVMTAGLLKAVQPDEACA